MTPTEEAMTREEIDAVFDRVRAWPEDRRRELADVAVEMEQAADQGVYELSDEELADLREAIAEAERGEFATAEEIEAILARYRG